MSTLKGKENASKYWNPFDNGGKNILTGPSLASESIPP